MNREAGEAVDGFLLLHLAQRDLRSPTSLYDLALGAPTPPYASHFGLCRYLVLGRDCHDATA